MKTVLRLAVLALAGTAALALAGNALATQQLSVRQTATSLTIKVSQAQSDPQPARIQIYVPAGYTINTSAAPGTKIGTTTGTVFARDQNIPLPLSGDVVAVPATTNAPGCDPVPHIAVWNLSLSVAGQTINLPVHVDQVTGAEVALGAQKLVVCLSPSDVPQGTPGRSPFGAQLLDATFTVEGADDALQRRYRDPQRGGNRRDSCLRRDRWCHAECGGHEPEQAGGAPHRPRLPGRVCGDRLTGDDPRQREGQLPHAHARGRELQPLSEEDRSTGHDDVPGTRHRRRARHHDDGLRDALRARRGLRERDELAVHGSQPQGQDPHLRTTA